jgi:hypothetical protein
MSSKEPSVRHLLHALSYKIACLQPNAPLTSDQICTVLRNCQRLRNDCIEVNLLLESMTRQLQRRGAGVVSAVGKSEQEVVLTAEQAKMCLGGLRNMSSEGKEIRALRKVLNEQLQLVQHEAEKQRAVVSVRRHREEGRKEGGGGGGSDGDSDSDSVGAGAIKKSRRGKQQQSSSRSGSGSGSTKVRREGDSSDEEEDEEDGQE